MRIRSVIVTSCLIAISLVSFGQKTKYKDIYPMLQAKNYSEGIPHLLKYLSIEENKNEANPNLQMGLWLHHRFTKLDKSSSNRYLEVGDSAILFLEKAKRLIDEKEVKKKDEYYQDFMRRDLRSGKFLIKVSDVHLDIENRVDEIKTKLKD